MSTHQWLIDEALVLHPVIAIPSTAKQLSVDEQLIDTLILRNLNQVSLALFDQPSRYLFNSDPYWGPFDECCLLSTGQIVVYENKSRKPTKKDLLKFRRDVQILKDGGEEYVRHRFEHAIAGQAIYGVHA